MSKRYNNSFFPKVYCTHCSCLQEPFTVEQEGRVLKELSRTFEISGRDTGWFGQKFPSFGNEIDNRMQITSLSFGANPQKEQKIQKTLPKKFITLGPPRTQVLQSNDVVRAIEQTKSFRMDIRLVLAGSHH